jgi:gliding motility-associated-like protein
VTTSDGRCPSEDEIDIVRDIKLFFPSAFTPNGDGQNDTWQILNLNSLRGAEVFVFNRNGGVIYYADKDGRPWDGMHENQKVPSGVYRYLVRAPGRPPQEGALHVIY